MMIDEINPKLTNICNLKTIQEESRGFFISLVENVKANTRLQEWAEDLWKEPIYGEEFIQLLIKQDDIFSEILKTFTVTEVYRKKCEKTASKMLFDAEQLWVSENWLQCREKCSQAVLRAPPKSESQNVSKESHILQKALLLRARCLCKEGKTSLAKLDLYIALQQGQLQGTAKEDVKEIFKELKKHTNDVNIDGNEGNNFSDIHLSGGEHADLLGASKLLTVSENLEQGRFISAAEDIKIGDTLIIEKPYAACLKPQQFGTHCHHCFETLEIPRGCPDCAAVAFCSEKCYIEATSTYHQYECKFMDLFIGSGMSILCHIALRMVTQIGLKDTLRIYEKYFKQNGINQNDPIINGEEMTDTLRHGAIYKLVTHELLRQPEDYVNRTLMAFFLTRCLQKTHFFNTESSPMEKLQTNILDSDVLSVWCVLLFNIQVLQFNAHQVCGLRGEKELGCALYATSSLFNHDCCPSVIRYFLGKKLVVVALRPVASGEAVGDSYGPQWGRNLPGMEGSKLGGERRDALRSRYWFSCKCRPCSQQWPLPPADFPGFKCPDKACSGIVENKVISENENCNLCQKAVDVDYIQQKYDVLKECFEKIKAAEEIQSKEEKILLLQSALMDYGELTPQPSVLSLRAEDAARSCYANFLSKSKIS